MKYLRLSFGLILTSLMLTSCGGDESSTTESTFDPMVETIDKAKTVEGLSADRTKELDKEIEKSQ